MVAQTRKFRNLDLGSADGIAGTVEIFPGTAAKGSLRIQATDQTGDTVVTLTTAAMGQATTVTIPDPGASAGVLGMSTAALTLAEMDVLDGVTAGTATASKAVVLGASKEISTITTATITNIDAGASGSAGTIDIFPSTASKGKIAIAAANNTNNDTTTITQAAQGGAYTYTIPDAGASAAFVMTAGNQTVGGTKTFSSAIVPTAGVGVAGGFTLRPSNVHTGGIPAQVSSDGTDATPSVSEAYYAAVMIPGNMTVTGVAVFLGSATEGNMKVGLFNSAGALLATSASTDVSGVSADTYFRIAFTATYAAVGPATYYVGILNDNTGNRFNAHTFGDFPASKTTGETYASGFTTISSPATTFTTALGPIASLY